MFERYAQDELLRDGGMIHLRAIKPEDKSGLLRLLDRMSARSVYYRFFATRKTLSDTELRYFTELDFHDRVALVATVADCDGEEIVGVGRYVVVAEVPRRAEVSFAVADSYQGRGIGTLLLDRLADIARAEGIVEFQANVLGENHAMLEVFRFSGFQVQRSLEDGAFHFSFPTEETGAHRDASAQRRNIAQAARLKRQHAPHPITAAAVSRRYG